MTQDEFNAFCATLPHTFHVVQWGDSDVWKVGIAGKNTNKVFVVGGWNKDSTEHKRGKGDRPSAQVRRARAGVEQSETAVSEIKSYAASFKCGEIAFEFLRDTPGCRPAPYLASRGMKWIQCLKSGGMTDAGITDADLEDYLRESHRLASLNLTKKLQKQLGLNQEGRDEFHKNIPPPPRSYRRRSVSIVSNSPSRKVDPVLRRGERSLGRLF